MKHYKPTRLESLRPLFKRELEGGVIPAPETVEAFRDNAHTLVYRRTFGAIVNVLEARDPYTAHHSQRVAAMAERLCDVLLMSPLETEAIGMTASVHDIGKVGIRDATLNKQGRLTDEEYAEMKRHPGIGADIILETGDLETVAEGVRHHHERWDGKGYPDGLAGAAIPYASRIIALCDSVDAMLSDRPYRPAMSAEACRAEIRSNAGVMYDPLLARVFLEHWDEIVTEYPR